MGRSIRIGRIKGVPIRVHWSFPLLLLLVLVPSSGGESAAAVVAGLAWIAVLFACIVVHELSHCFVARHRGFRVRDIVLLPIGGASEIEGLPGPPADELASPHFALLGEIARRNGLETLSMGMSADWPLAVQLGATHIRVGSAIFGPRAYGTAR